MNFILTKQEADYIENKRRQQILKQDLEMKNKSIEIKQESEKTKPIDIVEKPKKGQYRRRTKEELKEYRRLRDERLIKKNEYQEANRKLRIKKKERQQTAVKRKASTYILFQQKFAKAHKGIPNYRKELSKAWAEHKKSM